MTAPSPASLPGGDLAPHLPEKAETLGGQFHLPVRTHALAPPAREPRARPGPLSVADPAGSGLQRRSGALSGTISCGHTNVLTFLHNAKQNLLFPLLTASAPSLCPLHNKILQKSSPCPLVSSPSSPLPSFLSQAPCSTPLALFLLNPGSQFSALPRLAPPLLPLHTLQSSAAWSHTYSRCSSYIHAVSSPRTSQCSVSSLAVFFALGDLIKAPR